MRKPPPWLHVAGPRLDGPQMQTGETNGELERSVFVLGGGAVEAGGRDLDGEVFEAGFGARAGKAGRLELLKLLPQALDVRALSLGWKGVSIMASIC